MYVFNQIDVPLVSSIFVYGYTVQKFFAEPEPGSEGEGEWQAKKTFELIRYSYKPPRYQYNDNLYYLNFDESFSFPVPPQDYSHGTLINMKKNSQEGYLYMFGGLMVG